VKEKVLLIYKVLENLNVYLMKTAKIPVYGNSVLTIQK